MKIGFLFPGYGSQSVGMGKELYDCSRTVQEYFEEAAHCLDRNFVKLCFASSDTEISKLENALLANFLVSSSLYAFTKEQTSCTPDIVAGYGMGAFSALFAVGGINFPDGLYLINKYLSFYQDHVKQLDIKSIHVSGAFKDILEEICKTQNNDTNVAYISAYETDTDHIIVGSARGIDAVKRELIDKGIKRVKDIKHIEGLHSHLMDSVVKSLDIYSEKVDFKNLQVPMLTNSDVRSITDREEIKEAMMRHMLYPLHWVDCLRLLVDYDLIIEIGPGITIQEQVRKLYPEKRIISINKYADIEELQKLLHNEKGQDKEQDKLGGKDAII